MRDSLAPLLPVALQLGGSLAAVLLLAWLSRLFGLGGDFRIRDEAHALQLAGEGLYGFKGVDVARDLAGYSALVKDAANRHALVVVKGAHAITRLLHQPVNGRLDERLLTIDMDEPDFESVTLNLGEKAQYWASGLRHIPCG